MYNVAFVYTREARGYEGVITWTSFESKEDFDKWYTPEIRARERVVEEGITDERAVELCSRTPIACYAAAKLQDATMEDGSIDLFLLEMGIATVAEALAADEKDLGLAR